MAASDYDDTTGHPIFADGDAPDVAVNATQVAEYAGQVGTRLIGTTAERTAYDFTRKGLRWFDTTLNTEFVYTGSAWAEDFSFPASFSVAFAGPNYASSVASPVVGRIRNGEARLKGTARSTSSLGFTPGTNYTLGTIDSAIAPTEDQLFLVSAGDNNSARLVVQPSGTIIFAVLSAFTGFLSIGMSQVSWELP